ncbi:MAG: type I DNA topoisomerase [Clostridia bacterium]|nr:type I DNA topoisomerase [Clostridia bacterium]
MSKLVILESPTKAKTVQKYLGPGYTVTACAGHLRDLPEKKLGIEIEHNFKPQYVNMKGKEEIIARLRQAAADSDGVLLATDPDREGEAISWHLATLLGLDDQKPIRVTFNEITKNCVTAGIKTPRGIDRQLVDAQQSRRALDRLVGYKLSPFLWKKVRRGLSAGRVQSVAVRLVVDREQEIEAFRPEEYWSLDAKFSVKGERKTFQAHYFGTADGTKQEVTNGEQANAILASLDGADYAVTKVKKGTRTRQPAPPFITSTLQQEASRKLNMTGQRTMRIAQELYEGVSVEGIGATGLITYMRTDSLRISDEARAEGMAYIRKAYGDAYLPDKQRVFRAASGAQDGHEAIRPTIPSLTPDQVKASLTAEQYKLYKLIWERFIAALMAPCLQNTVNVDITARDALFKASGFTVKFEGYTVLYEEGSDDEDEQAASLPAMKEGDALTLRELIPNQHFTKPPARYTEATLIEAFKQNGIGRPSTYAPTIATILSREYIVREKKSLMPTELGKVTTQLMKDLFSDIVDVKFTAGMEKNLDLVASGEKTYEKVMEAFYRPFAKTLAAAEESMQGKKVELNDTMTDEVCPNCGKPMVIKFGRFGKFMACSGYPECKTTKPIVTPAKGVCPMCGAQILQKKSTRGYKYFGCETAPKCDFMTWNEPTDQLCPQCGKTLFKKRGMLLCETEGCGYEQKAARKSRKTAGDNE